MKRGRAGRPAPLEDRDLAAEVTYLHSLWRRGPSKPASAAAVPNQSGTARSGPGKKSKRRRTGPESPPASASAAPSSPEKSTPHPVAAQEEEAVTDRSASRSARGKGNKGKRRGVEETQQDAGSEKKPLAASSPPTANKSWADAPTSPSSPLKPTTPTPPSPGSLAHREALRAAEEFFATHGSDEDDDDDEEEEMSESEGDEEAATEFFTGLFERDAVLRGHYERGWEEGQFACMACVGKKKARKGKARRFRGCVSLVQHARAAKSYGRPGAHRALAAVVCRVLGWDVQRLPSIVLDRRGTLSQELAARAQTDAQEAKEDVGTEINGSDTNGDELANEVPTSKESAEMKDVEEIASLDHEDSSANETDQEKDVVETGMDEPINIDGEKEITELSGGEDCSEKDEDSANKDNSLSQDNNAVHGQDTAIESTEKENVKDMCSKDTFENEKHCVTVSVQDEENVDESKEDA